MLDVELIENLYNGLDKEQKELLMTQVFKKSKQGIPYFRRTNDITLSKVEIIGDFFQLPLDYFRQGDSFAQNAVSSFGNRFQSDGDRMTRLLIYLN